MWERTALSRTSERTSIRGLEIRNRQVRGSSSGVGSIKKKPLTRTLSRWERVEEKVKQARPLPFSFGRSGRDEGPVPEQFDGRHCSAHLTCFLFELLDERGDDFEITYYFFRTFLDGGSVQHLSHISNWMGRKIRGKIRGQTPFPIM